jgi:hypothetical protein
MQKADVGAKNNKFVRYLKDLYQSTQTRKQPDLSRS